MLESSFPDRGASRRRKDLKKQQTGSKKLVLSKETLTQVVQVTGGSEVNDTVYHPKPRRVTDYGCGIA